MTRHMFAGEHTAVAVADDDGIAESFVRQIFCGELIVFDSLGDGLIGAADAVAAIVGAHRVMAAPIERHECIAESSDMGREKACGANVEIHLVAVAVHRRALDRTIGSVVRTIQGMRRRGNADKFGAHGQLLANYLVQTYLYIEVDYKAAVGCARAPSIQNGGICHDLPKKCAVSRESCGQLAKAAGASTSAREA